MELNELENIRAEKMRALRDMGIEPYPTRNSVTHQIVNAIDHFLSFEEKNPDQILEQDITIGGRIRSKRTMGKLAFCDVEDGSDRLQVLLRLNELGEEKLVLFKEFFDIGDFIQASGNMMRSRRGEITLLVKDFSMLAKAISPLPAAKDVEKDGEIVSHATLSDPETRCR